MSDHPSQLIATLRLRLPGAGTDAIMSELSNAMHEFCTTTAAWRCDVERNLIANQDLYELQLAETGEIFEIIQLKVDGARRRPLSPDVTKSASGFVGYRVDRQQASRVYLYPTPTANLAKGLKVVVALRPTMGTITMPIDIIERYHSMLLDGALARMYSHINKPYTNMDMAERHARAFRADITRTRRIVRGADSQASPGWVYPQQAPGGSRRGARTVG